MDINDSITVRVIGEGEDSTRASEKNWLVKDVGPVEINNDGYVRKLIASNLLPPVTKRSAKKFDFNGSPVSLQGSVLLQTIRGVQAVLKLDSE